MWNYAEMTKQACEKGGPEVFMDSLVKEGIKVGRLEMLPLTILAGIVGTTAGIGINKLVICYKETMKKVNEDIVITKEKVIGRFLKEESIQEIITKQNV